MRDELGCGVLLVEHDMRIIFRVCERIQVLDYGKTIAVGTAGGDPRRQAGGRRLPGRERSGDCSSSADVSVHYGRVAAVQRALARGQGGRARRPRRPQRGRQVDDAVDDHGRPQAERRVTITVRGQVDRGPSPRRDPASRDRARPGEPPDLRPALRGGEPAHRRCRPARTASRRTRTSRRPASVSRRSARSSTGGLRSSREASSSSSRSPARCSRGRSSCSSTSRRSGSPR